MNRGSILSLMGVIACAGLVSFSVSLRAEASGGAREQENTQDFKLTKTMMKSLANTMVKSKQLKNKDKCKLIHHTRMSMEKGVSDAFKKYARKVNRKLDEVPCPELLVEKTPFLADEESDSDTSMKPVLHDLRKRILAENFKEGSCTPLQLVHDALEKVQQKLQQKRLSRELASEVGATTSDLEDTDVYHIVDKELQEYRVHVEDSGCLLIGEEDEARFTNMKL